jgi:hypothetical protein
MTIPATRSCGQLDYYTTPVFACQHLFSSFFNFFRIWCDLLYFTTFLPFFVENKQKADPQSASLLFVFSAYQPNTNQI